MPLRAQVYPRRTRSRALIPIAFVRTSDVKPTLISQFYKFPNLVAAGLGQLDGSAADRSRIRENDFSSIKGLPPASGPG